MRLPELLREFDGLEPEEKLEMLVDFAEELPPLSPARAQASPREACRVQECQTAVYLWVDVVDGKLHLEADVPRNSPTVRGLVALVVLGLEGATPAELEGLPSDLVGLLGLEKTLGMTRQHGMRGVMAAIRRGAAPARSHSAERT